MNTLYLILTSYIYLAFVWQTKLKRLYVNAILFVITGFNIYGLTQPMSVSLITFNAIALSAIVFSNYKHTILCRTLAFGLFLMSLTMIVSY